MQWEMKPEHSITGGDLYTTVWATIASMLKRLAIEYKKAEDTNDDEQKWKSMQRDGPFFQHVA